MSRTDELPPDQHAALSLLLRQRKSYAEVAALLKIPEQAVHDRAHAALAVLAPGEARGVPAPERERIVDYLLSQQPAVAERMRARSFLSSSQPANEWASALARELAPLLSGAELPEVPPLAAGAQAQEQVEPAPQGQGAGPVPVSAAAGVGGPPWEQAERSLPSSRVGGALLLALVLIGAILAVILTSSGGGGKSHSETTAKTTATTPSSGPKIERRFALKSPVAGSRTTGAAEILSEAGKRALYVEAQHIPATRHFFYAIWLYNSHSEAAPVGRAPAVGRTHAFAGATAVPEGAGKYRELLVTRETSTHPTHPGHVVLRGAVGIGEG